MSDRGRNFPFFDSPVIGNVSIKPDNENIIEAIVQVSSLAGIPERTLKRRFKAATGSTLIAYLQNLRVEEAKRLLESGQKPVDEISEEAGYSDTSFFRRVFKRLTGLTPSHYRRLFQPIANA